MNSKPNRKIFVIYTTRDKFFNVEILRNISKELECFGEVFIDFLHNNSDNKQEYVLERLYESSWIVIVETPKLRESKWAQLEIRIAKEMGIEILGYYKYIMIEDTRKFVFQRSRI